MHNHAMDRPTLPAISASALLVALALPGCGMRHVYEGLQAGQRSECQRLAEPERGRCLERANLRYDDYEKERDKAKPKAD
jgi:uncharacterized protein YbbK (DUF523 family)